MDNIDKALNKFSAKERVGILSILRKIQRGNFDGLDVKMWRGNTIFYRTQKDPARIIYKKDESDIPILSLSRRNDTTYKDF